MEVRQHAIVDSDEDSVEKKIHDGTNDRISEESLSIPSKESVNSKADKPVQVTNAKADGYFSAIQRFVENKIWQTKKEVKDLVPMKPNDSNDSLKRPKELNKLAFEE